MDCDQTTWLSNKEFFRQFNKKVSQQRIPLSGSIDLTYRCNMRCVHCYLGEKEGIQNNSCNELGTSKWISIIDEFTGAGCLTLLITGGDPLMREDFSEIYRHAKKKGLLVTVFTNGTLISDSILELFKDLPPRAVEISLYGATADTYERITGVRGSYKKCISGIRDLLDNKINLRLKTVLMTLNSHEFFNMEKMAKELGVEFRFDAAIFPCFNGDKTPLNLRVTPEEAITKEFSDIDRSRKWIDFFKRMQGLPSSNTLYNCGTGLTGFHINPYGSLQPCIMVRNIAYNLSSGSFSKGWNTVIPRIREKKAKAGFICSQCEKRTLCGFCPAFFELENETEDIYSEYLCATGQYRYKTIEKACI